MKSLSQTLGQLLAVAEGIVTRPQSLDAAMWLQPIAAEIRRADARPAEGVRTTNAALVMIIALEQFLGSDREPTSPWLMLAGAALPLLRGDLFVAMRNEREQGASS